MATILLFSTMVGSTTDSTLPQNFDKNVAVECYSHSFGNRLNLLVEYREEVGYEDASGLAREVDEIQGALWGIVVRTAGRYDVSSFTAEELEAIIRKYARRHAAWLNDVGIAALTQWLCWIAWHEGYMRRDDASSYESGNPPPID